MTDDLRALDEEIARLRGWVTPDPHLPNYWLVPIGAPPDSPARQDECRRGTYFGACPAYSSSWALAGPLLDELLDAADAPLDGAGMGHLLAQAVAGPEGRLRVIASTWLVWKRGRP